MAGLIASPWTVNFASGLVVGAFFHFLARFALEQRRKFECQRSIREANDDVVSNLRSLVLEGTVDAAIVESVAAGAALKHDVERDRLYTRELFTCQLIRQVTGSSWIPTEQKTRLFKQLLEVQRDGSVEPIMTRASSGRRSNVTPKAVAIAVGIIGALVAIVVMDVVLKPANVSVSTESMNVSAVGSGMIVVLMVVTWCAIMLSRGPVFGSYLRSLLDRRKPRVEPSPTFDDEARGSTDPDDDARESTDADIGSAVGSVTRGSPEWSRSGIVASTVAGSGTASTAPDDAPPTDGRT